MSESKLVLVIVSGVAPSFIEWWALHQNCEVLKIYTYCSNRIGFNRSYWSLAQIVYEIYVLVILLLAIP